MISSSLSWWFNHCLDLKWMKSIWNWPWCLVRCTVIRMVSIPLTTAWKKSFWNCSQLKLEYLIFIRLNSMNTMHVVYLLPCSPWSPILNSIPTAWDQIWFHSQTKKERNKNKDKKSLNFKRFFNGQLSILKHARTLSNTSTILTSKL